MFHQRGPNSIRMWIISWKNPVVWKSASEKNTQDPCQCLEVCMKNSCSLSKFECFAKCISDRKLWSNLLSGPERHAHKPITTYRHMWSWIWDSRTTNMEKNNKLTNLENSHTLGNYMYLDIQAPFWFRNRNSVWPSLLHGQIPGRQSDEQWEVWQGFAAEHWLRDARIPQRSGLLHSVIFSRWTALKLFNLLGGVGLMISVARRRLLHSEWKQKAWISFHVSPKENISIFCRQRETWFREKAVWWNSCRN